MAKRIYVYEREADTKISGDYGGGLYFLSNSKKDKENAEFTKLGTLEAFIKKVRKKVEETEECSFDYAD